NQISLTPEVGTPVYNPEYVDKKSQRYELILGKDSPGIDVIRSDIVNGRQDVWDRAVSDKEAIQENALRMSIAQEYLETRDPTVAPSLEEVLTFQNLVGDRAPLDPLDALSRTAAKMLTGIVSSHPESVVVQEGLEDDPNLTYDSLDRAEYSSQRALAAQDIAEEINGRYSQEGFVKKGTAWLRDFIPLLNSVAIGSLEESLGDKGLGSILNGSTIDEQISNLYALPPQEFRAKLKETVDYLYDINPHVAQQFASAAINYSDDNRLTDSFFSIVDFASVVPVAKGGQAARVLKNKALQSISKT